MKSCIYLGLRMALGPVALFAYCIQDLIRKRILNEISPCAPRKALCRVRPKSGEGAGFKALRQL